MCGEVYRTRPVGKTVAIPRETEQANEKVTSCAAAVTSISTVISAAAGAPRRGSLPVWEPGAGLARLATIARPGMPGSFCAAERMQSFCSSADCARATVDVQRAADSRNTALTGAYKAFELRRFECLAREVT